jgi:thiosulfate/3-mercaptopyruvate sulfurtransferase
MMMKPDRFMMITLLMLSLSYSELRSQPENPLPGLLVSTEWLEENLADTSLVILHIGNEEGYYAGHIPGARMFSMDMFVVDDDQGRRNEIPEIEKLEQALRFWGINNYSKVIICHGDKYGLITAARLYLTLDYAGMGDRSAILNGGFPAWKKENRSLTTETSVYKEGSFKCVPRDNMVVSKQWVFNNLESQGVAILDARPRKIYSGKSEDHNTSRRGHIPGAINLSYDLVAESEAPNYFKSPDALKLVFEEQGIHPGDTIVSYCGSGIWAASVYVASRILGYDAHFYDGSFQEWGNDDTMPVEK